MTTTTTTISVYLQLHSRHTSIESVSPELSSTFSKHLSRFSSLSVSAGDRKHDTYATQHFMVDKLNWVKTNICDKGIEEFIGYYIHSDNAGTATTQACYWLHCSHS